MNQREALDRQGRSLDQILGWIRVNKLKMNPDKTEVMLVKLVGQNLILRSGFTVLLNGAVL